MGEQIIQLDFVRQGHEQHDHHVDASIVINAVLPEGQRLLDAIGAVDSPVDLGGAYANSTRVERCVAAAVNDDPAATKRLTVATGPAGEVAVMPDAVPVVGARKPVVIRRLISQVLRVCPERSEENTSELQSLMRNSYSVFCFK